MTARSFHDGRAVLHHGDMLEIVDALAENSIDSCVVDPPYHLTSITKRFGGPNAAPAQHGTDGAFARASKGFLGKSWDGGDIAFRPETWAKVLRVLKPGAYIVAFAATRNYHHMAVAIEAAGFITHPMIGWITGQGMPKATRVQTEGYDGFRYGTQSMKPALEPIYVGQKPFSEKTGTANILRWGTGAINIDACRVEPGAKKWDSPRGGIWKTDEAAIGELIDNPLGRWPANVVLENNPDVIAAFPVTHGAGAARSGEFGGEYNATSYDMSGAREMGRFGDEGSTARFFYQAKASKQDRAGSSHPTCKPVRLIEWLCRLVTPPGGTVLDCFAGSGTTGQAALNEGFQVVLVEREAEYVADIVRRLSGEPPEPTGGIFGDEAGTTAPAMSGMSDDMCDEGIFA